MALLKQLVESNTVDVNNVEDYSGSSYIGQSGIYDLIIDRAWVIESEKGALGIHIEFKGEGILEQDIYITNKDKQTFYNKNGKDMAMPGYIDMKKLNYVVTGQFLTSLSQLNVSEQIVKTYTMIDDPGNEGKKKRSDIEKEVELLIDWSGKEVKVGIQMEEQEKSEKQNGKYVGTGQVLTNKDGIAILKPNIIGYYNNETSQTANEMKKDIEATQINKDKERLEKAPIKQFKAKSKAPVRATASSAVNKPAKPNVFG